LEILSGGKDYTDSPSSHPAAISRQIDQSYENVIRYTRRRKTNSAQYNMCWTSSFVRAKIK
jgi:hypothetical protein